MDSGVGVSVSKTGLLGCVVNNEYISPIPTIGSREEAFVTSIPARIINIFVYSDVPMDNLDDYVNKCYKRADGFPKAEYIQGLAKIFRFKSNNQGNIDTPVMIEYNFKYIAQLESSYIHRFQFEDLYLDLHLVDKLFKNSPQLSGRSMFRIIRILSNNNGMLPLELSNDSIYDYNEEVTDPTEIINFIKLHDSHFTMRSKSIRQLELLRKQQQGNNSEKAEYIGRVTMMQETGSFNINYSGEQQGTTRRCLKQSSR
jgi:hypothetical protein